MMFLCRRLISAALFTCFCLLSLGLKAQPQPQVSVTIQPLQLIAAAITEGVSEPELIFGINQSPHHAALKPSQRGALEDAEVLLWIGPTMETNIAKVITGLDAKVITVMELDDIQTLPLRKNIDPHLWLNTANARLIGKALSKELSFLDAENSDLYRKNLVNFEVELDKLDEKIQTSFNQHESLGYGIHHNALQYYEQQFGLERIVSFTDDEELQPGIRQLLSIKKTIQENQLDCLLVEPSINTDELSSKIDDDDMRYVRINVLGTSTPKSKNAYVNFMLSLTDSVIECLR